MKSVLNYILCAALFVPFFAGAAGEYNPASVGAGKPEIHITADGVMRIKAAKVNQIIGTTFFLNLKWGELPMQFTMKTDTNTSVTKRYGGGATTAEIKQGDYLDASGEFFVGSDVDDFARDFRFKLF